MSWCDAKLGLEPDAELTRELLVETGDKIAGLPIADLVRAFHEIQTVNFTQRTTGIYCFDMYFDRLGHDDPARALSFIIAAVELEPDDAIVAMLAKGKLLMQLLHGAAEHVVAGLEVAAESARLCWL